MNVASSSRNSFKSTSSWKRIFQRHFLGGAAQTVEGDSGSSLADQQPPLFVKERSGHLRQRRRAFEICSFQIPEMDSRVAHAVVKVS